MYELYTKNGYEVHLVPNAIDISSFPSQEDRRYEKQIIFAGRLSEEKGILDVINMGYKLPDHIHLLILGTGPEENKVKKLESPQSQALGTTHTRLLDDVYPDSRLSFVVP